MQNELTWVTLSENLEDNVLYSQILNLLENKNELKEIAKLSGCSGTCNGICRH